MMLKVFSELLTPSKFVVPLRNYIRPMSKAATAPKEEEFKIDLDVSRFKPEELKVTVEDDIIVIEGAHEEKSNFGYISKQFTRMYRVPNGVDVKSLVSNLTSEGILSLKAPIKVIEPTTHEIPITHVNKEESSSDKKAKEPEKS